MTLTLISFGIAALALGVIAFLIVRHWKEIRLLDPLSIREEQAKQKRDDMIERRFERVAADRLEAARRLGREAARSATSLYRRTYQRLKSFEKLYKKATSPLAIMAPSTREKIKVLLAEARSLARDLKWADAERRYIEVLSLDARQSDAYRGLGQIYLKQKLFPQAKETFDFLVKIKKADDATYAGLAEIADAEGNIALAEAMRKKAVDASPRLAHRYAELAEFYVAHKEYAKAWTPAKRASELEPGSAKYLEQSLETAILLGDQKEARERFGRLRLLIDDPARFQGWKEKIDALFARKK